MDSQRSFYDRQNDITKVVINGKRRQSFIKRGVVYVQEGFAAEPSEVAKFENIVYMAGWDKDQAYRTMMRLFNKSTGLGEQVRIAGDLYDKNDISGRMGETFSRMAKEIGMI